MTPIINEPTLGRHAVRDRRWPQTGAELLMEAASQAASAPRLRDMTPKRALLFALIGVAERRAAEMIDVAQSWFDATHGPGSWVALTGEDAAVPLAQCALSIEVALERATGDAPIGGRAYAGQLTQTELFVLDAWLALRRPRATPSGSAFRTRIGRAAHRAETDTADTGSEDQ